MATYKPNVLTNWGPWPLQNPKWIELGECDSIETAEWRIKVELDKLYPGWQRNGHQFIHPKGKAGDTVIAEITPRYTPLELLDIEIAELEQELGDIPQQLAKAKSKRAALAEPDAPTAPEAKAVDERTVVYLEMLVGTMQADIVRLTAERDAARATIAAALTAANEGKWNTVKALLGGAS